MKSLQDRLMSATRFSSDIQLFEIHELFGELEKTKNLLQKIVDIVFGVKQLLSPKQKIDMIDKLIVDQLK